MLLLVDDLYIAEGGTRFGVPVDHTLSAINKAFTVKVDEHLNDGFRADGIHGEGRALPIA